MPVSGVSRISAILWQLSLKSRILFFHFKSYHWRRVELLTLRPQGVMPKAYYLSLCEHLRQESICSFIENSVFLSEVGFLQCLSFNALWLVLIQCDDTPLRLWLCLEEHGKIKLDHKIWPIQFTLKVKNVLSKNICYMFYFVEPLKFLEEVNGEALNEAHWIWLNKYEIIF